MTEQQRPPLGAVLAEVLQPHLMLRWLRSLPEDTGFPWEYGNDPISRYVLHATNLHTHLVPLYTAEGGWGLDWLQSQRGKEWFIDPVKLGQPWRRLIDDTFNSDPRWWSPELRPITPKYCVKALRDGMDFYKHGYE